MVKVKFGCLCAGAVILLSACNADTFNGKLVTAKAQGYTQPIISHKSMEEIQQKIMEEQKRKEEEQRKEPDIVGTTETSSEGGTNIPMEVGTGQTEEVEATTEEIIPDTFSHMKLDDSYKIEINGKIYNAPFKTKFSVVQFPEIGGVIGKIYIPSINIDGEDIIVGATQEIVDSNDICMSTRCSYFGDKRPSLLCGHNNRSFQGLFNLHEDSYIFIETEYGGWVYKVKHLEYGTINDDYTEIYDGEGKSLIVENKEYDSQILQLYTCFGDTLGTHERLVVTAEMVVGTKLLYD